MRKQLQYSFGSVRLRQGTCHPSRHWPKLSLSRRNLSHCGKNFLLSIARHQRTENVVNGFEAGRPAGSVGFENRHSRTPTRFAFSSPSLTPPYPPRNTVLGEGKEGVVERLTK